MGDPGEARYKRIAREIRTDIEAGRLRHGQALPPTRVMAEEGRTSVHTINEAMRILTEEGWVISKSRSQRLVNAPDQQISKPQVRLEKPVVLLIGGYAGSGKTELGRMIARETGWAILDKDTITRPVVEAALEVMGSSPNDRESDIYLSSVRPREYEALDAAVTEQLECGTSAIATAPYLREFTDPAWIQRTRSAADTRSARVVFLWVRCDPLSMHTYLRRRGAARDASKLANWESYLEGLNLEFQPETPHLVVENSLDSPPLQEQAIQVVQKVTKQT